jgi:hypothetical protein
MKTGSEIEEEIVNEDNFDKQTKLLEQKWYSEEEVEQIKRKEWCRGYNDRLRDLNEG